MQDCVPVQSEVRWHTGAASPGVTQKPPAQTMALPHWQQSLSLAQPARQAPFTHMLPLLQSRFELQAGCGRSSARQSPSSQRSSGLHSVSAWQAPRQ